MADTVVPFLSRRRERAVLGQKLPYVLGALVLFGAGVVRIGGETRTAGLVLAGLEVLASCLVLFAFVRVAFRAVRAKTEDLLAARHGPDWVDLFLAGMFAVDTFAQHAETGHWSGPTMVMTATMLVAGLAHGPITALARRRLGLHFSNKGVRIGRRLRRFTATWAELKPIAVGERWAALETLDGRTYRIDLHDLGNAQQVRDALREVEILRTAKRRFSPRTPAEAAFLGAANANVASAADPAVLAAVPPRSPQPPTLIERPTLIQAAGTKPKTIEEYAGLVNSGHASVSVARMVSPEGWIEPGQQPEFEEITVVLRGMLRVEYRGGTLDVRAGQAVVSHPREWIRYSSPDPGGAEYVAICLPAFSPNTVHRDAP